MTGLATAEDALQDPAGGATFARDTCPFSLVGVSHEPRTSLQLGDGFTFWVRLFFQVTAF
jgi:hypothetical protein